MLQNLQVLLTPLAIADNQGHFVCLAIRDPDTQEIIATVVTSYDLAQKANIPQPEAQRIFQAVQTTAAKRCLK